ncbi:unnamed protein product [Penicillium olsonii]|uniref:MT-A70-domain-containing protein n=1 Tax=Penicillium olsonii TaxID=99116 RepID=A0A9W4HNL8_PENOL|nr:unnamed protein product [Penicillium olsonii]CAG8071571.1 unnamed protein product [Penicillium olsonii]
MDHKDDTAVIFQGDKVVLIDIPRSITIAQGRLPVQQSSPKGSSIEQKRLLSCRPLKEPYPSTEPKNPTARANVLQTIPIPERRFHSEIILPLVKHSLERIRAATSSTRWGLDRLVPIEHRIPVSKDAVSRKRRKENPPNICCDHVFSDGPPLILSSSSPNEFRSLCDLNVVKNPSTEPAIIKISHNGNMVPSSYMIPPESSFILGTLPLFETPNNRSSSSYPIPGLSSHQKFNLILMDPPWPNRSVRRSAHYQTHHYSEMEVLAEGLRDILRKHSYNPEATPQASCTESPPESRASQSIAAIWITNAEKSRKAAYQALVGSGFRICEEWVWIKTTIDGQPISVLDGIWRKPYEILVIGRRDADTPISEELRPSLPTMDDLAFISESVTTRRVIAAVPDLHSRKPNLKGMFERVFFESGQSQSYSALEVFARNLTAGWWAVGNEVFKFNACECWADPSETGYEWITGQ